jgi:hypothetical protein
VLKEGLRVALIDTARIGAAVAMVILEWAKLFRGAV